jgi:uncharacterized protein YdaU (DUF1376 family)
MHYYKRNIGDYHKKAGRLTMLQHGAFTLLMDSCYDRERFPTRDEALEWLWTSSKEEIEAVEFVLCRFFDLEDGVYVQKRIQDELANYHKNAKTNKRIAIDRETKRREKRTNRAQSVDGSNTLEHEAPPNHKPITTNQEPITTKEPVQRKRFTPPIKNEVYGYMVERGLNSNQALTESEKFMDHYLSNGWKVGRNAMKNWKAAVRNWTKGKDYGSHQQASTKRGQVDHDDTSWGDEFLSQPGDSFTGQQDLRQTEVHPYRLETRDAGRNK